MANLLVNWPRVRIKDVAAINPATFFEDATIPFLPMSDISTNGFEVKEYKNIDDTVKYSQAQKGDVLFAKVTPCFENGKGCVIDISKPVLATTEVTVLRAKKAIRPAYLRLITQSIDFRQYGVNNMKGANGLKRVTEKASANYSFLLPTTSEQSQILSYVDDRTNAIDSKIQLLEEKSMALAELRKSVIHQAVTKGLDLNVRMKPSGVDWIGDIPFNWEIRRTKEICTYVSGDTPDSGKAEFYANDDTGFPWMTIRDLGEKIVTFSKNKISQKGIDSKKMIRQKAGTLMMSFKLSVGVTSIAGVECYTNEAIASFKGLYTPYWYYAIGPLVTQNAKENIYGAPLLNKTLILNAYVVVPTQEEQATIAKYLDDRTSVIDDSIRTITGQIATLKSLRQSLIHEAVTGKIDVADFGYKTV